MMFIPKIYFWDTVTKTLFWRRFHFGYPFLENRFSRWETLNLFPFEGGDPAAPSSTATLLRLHPSH